MYIKRSYIHVHDHNFIYTVRAELVVYMIIAGNVISVLVFLSPVETFWKIVKRRSTEEYECLPYICTLMGSLLWTYYGILKTVALVLALNVIFPVIMIVGTRTAFGYAKTRSNSMGFICAALNIIMYGSPLSAIKTVVKTRSVKYMPFWLSFLLFLNGAIWAVYALLLHDVFLLVPNGMGFFLGTVQLLIYTFYRNAKPNIEDEEEALAPSLPLLS
ncbi:unnamed protein product [Brassica oleracea var. botrytis]|uniref:Bidirectional sugar transporter SWEET n=2 Tax=Brassica oleracea TaxID=3712 RepID=A0A0D3BBN7_BRAOL|nr:unnamed protein product [Brassica oleracea]